MNFKKTVLPIIIIIGLQISGCSQLAKEAEMKKAANKLILGLKKCDTTQILQLYEVSASHLDQENYRTFTKENILNDCSWYKKITAKYGEPDLNRLTFTKDPQTAANVAVLPVLQGKDTSLNLKSSTLFIEFYPDQFFNGRIFHFTLTKQSLEIKETIKVPPIIQH